MAKTTKAPKAQTPLSSVLIPAAIVLAIGAAVFSQQQTPTGFSAYLPLTPAASKPFATFAEFFPFYLTEHSLSETRRLHFAGTALVLLVGLLMPSTLLAFFTALAAGAAVFPMTRSLPHGFVEAAAMIATFICVARPLNGSWAKTVFALVLPYAFAWVGHFFFEHNRPASFIYPTYSLLGDLRMFAGMATGEVPW